MPNKTATLCDQLKETLPPVFSTKDITPLLENDYSSPQKKVTQLEKQGYLFRLKRGFYTFEEFCNRYLIAGTLHSPSYISYETALSFYNMIPEKVETIYSVVSGRPLEIDTSVGSFIYRSQSKTLYSLGMSMTHIDKNSFLIASKEKALLDTLAQHKLSTTTLSNSDVYQYVIESLRVEPSELLNLSCRELKKISKLYRNHAPRKLSQEIDRIKKGQS